jgi:hypothetical protein
MQALKSLFTRAQAQRAVVLPQVQTAQPTELSADSLKLVGGGLPRIGGGAEVPPVTTTSMTLPSVS